MKQKDFKKKHVFCIVDNDTFSYLIIDSLINKLGLEDVDIKVLVFPSGSILNTNYKRLPKIEYIEYDSKLLLYMEEVKSFTFISLNNWNVPIIKEIFDLKKELLDKVYIYITDDELDRWQKNINKYGILTKETNNHISEDLLFLLPKLKNFIAPKYYYYDKITKILNRNNISVIDSSGIFEILLTKDSNNLFTVINEMENTKFSGKQIMIGTKTNVFSVREIIKVINSFRSINIYQEYSFIVMLTLKKRIYLDMYLFYLQFFKKIKVKINYFSQMTPFLYNVLLASNSHLILQPRGGVSSARLFVKWGCGSLCTATGSSNSNVFEKVYKTKCIFFDNLEHIAKSIVTSEVDIVMNQEAVESEELRSIEFLRKVYN
ncbi:hypothetical protein [Sulfurimonas marina]|uniref:Glycosyltransferase family 4 protein n=1 Tax=Sulfurimonas marina TaxID=2590551 RepID=A0A7M1AWR2_9BACT|nr:hypothetical protein [Sulfurimonas marina]QOP40822.1 hypothetical protein FJR03_03330 [Sulfurimonas marina]